MKKTGIIALLCCAFALCLVLAGCGSPSDGSDEATGKDAFSGTWILTSMSQDGAEASSDDISTLAALGMEVKLTLNEDGSAQMDMIDDHMSGTWEFTSSTEGAATLDGQAVELRIEGETLNMLEKGYTMSFKKVQAKEAASSSAAASGEASEASEAAEPAESEASSSASAV